MAQIGIKLADGSFFPIMDDDAPRRRRVVLSPARDDQEGVQIDIILRDGETDQYVGCLVLEDLTVSENRDLELVLGLDGDGTLSAHAGDAGGEQYQSLAISLDQLDKPEHFSLPEDFDDRKPGVEDAGVPEDLEIPDIEMPDLDEVSFDDYESESDSESDSEFFEEEDQEPGEVERRPYNIAVLLAIILVSLSLLALGAYGVVRLLGARMLPELRAATWFIPAIPISIRQAKATGRR